MIDYIIVGQGIAGSALSWELLKANKRILVINNKLANQASQVAAGIYNPITGRNIAKTWLADEVFPTLIQFYTEVETSLSTRFLYPKPIFKPFVSEQERSLWQDKYLENGYGTFCVDTNSAYKKEYVFNAYGGFLIEQAGYVDVPCYLKAVRGHLVAKNSYVEDDFEYNKICFLDNFVEYNGIRATKIIFCEGPQATLNPFFSYLPFKLVKGELLSAQIAKPLDIIYNRSVFVLPITNEKVLIGATYDWDDLTLIPTNKARNELITKTQKLLRIPYNILGQQAGIRPATLDRRPWLGLHPTYSQLGIFNGLGSKGVSLAPYLAKEFVQHLIYNKELLAEVKLDRIDR